MDKRSDPETHILKIQDHELYLDDFKVKRVTRAKLETDIDFSGVTANLTIELSVNPKMILDYFGDNSSGDLKHGSQ